MEKRKEDMANRQEEEIEPRKAFRKVPQARVFIRTYHRLILRWTWYANGKGVLQTRSKLESESWRAVKLFVNPVAIAPLTNSYLMQTEITIRYEDRRNERWRTGSVTMVVNKSKTIRLCFKEWVCTTLTWIRQEWFPKVCCSRRTQCKVVFSFYTSKRDPSGKACGLHIWRIAKEESNLRGRW